MDGNKNRNRATVSYGAPLLLGTIILACPLALGGASVTEADPGVRAAPHGSADPTPVAVTLPVLAAVERSSAAPGETIRLHFSLRNTVGRMLYYGDSGRLTDWGFAVDWLGTDGRSPAWAVPETDMGIKELAPRMAGMNANIPLAPGKECPGPVVSIDRLFDMRQRGVYGIRVSRQVSLDPRWKARKIFTSPLVMVRVQ
jgi:hypothetical protein